MTGLEWALTWLLVFLYISFVFTVCLLTFRKGHTLLGILGIFLPILWLVGALLPAKRGSRQWVNEGMRRQAEMEQMTR
jgi:hypothetical protein